MKTELRVTSYELREGGFTLVELLLYLGIASIMITVVSIFVQAMFEARIKHQTVSEVEQQGQMGMNRIGQTLRKGTAVCTPTAGATSSTLSINTGAGCGANQPTIFDINSGRLRIKEGAAATVDLTNNKVDVALVSSDLAKNLKVTSGVPTADQKDSIRIKFEVCYASCSSPPVRREYNYERVFQSGGSVQ